MKDRSKIGLRGVGAILSFVVLASLAAPSYSQITSGTLTIYSLGNMRANKFRYGRALRSFKIDVKNDQEGETAYTIQPIRTTAHYKKVVTPYADSLQVQTVDMKDSSKPQKQCVIDKHPSALHELDKSDRRTKTITIKKQGMFLSEFSTIFTGFGPTNGNPRKTVKIKTKTDPSALYQAFMMLETDFSRLGNVDPERPRDNYYVHFDAARAVTRVLTSEWAEGFSDLILGLNCQYKIRAVYTIPPGWKKPVTLAATYDSPPMVVFNGIIAQTFAADGQTIQNLFYQFTPAPFQESMVSSFGDQLGQVSDQDQDNYYETQNPGSPEGSIASGGGYQINNGDVQISGMSSFYGALQDGASLGNPGQADSGSSQQLSDGASALGQMPLLQTPATIQHLPSVEGSGAQSSATGETHPHTSQQVEYRYVTYAQHRRNQQTGRSPNQRRARYMSINPAGLQAESTYVNARTEGMSRPPYNRTVSSTPDNDATQKEEARTKAGIHPLEDLMSNTRIPFNWRDHQGGDNGGGGAGAAGGTIFQPRSH